MPKYDVIVAGAGFGGLVAAALLSVNNKRVLIIEPGTEIGGSIASFSKDGFHFSAGPLLTFGFGRGGDIDRLLGDLGIAQDVSVYSPVYQVALPDRRINIYFDIKETIEELSREFRGEIDIISRFYRNIRKKAAASAKGGFRDWVQRSRQAGQFLSGYRFSREFRLFLDAQAVFFFGRPASDLSISGLVTMVDTTPVAIHGGFVRLAGQILDVFLKNGGEIRYRTPFRMPVVSGRRLVLSLIDGDAEAEYVLLSHPLDKVGGSLFIAAKSEVIPVGMARNVICLPDYSDLNEIFFISRSGDDEEYKAPRGMCSLTATFPYLQDHLDEQALIAKVGAIIPFLNEFTIFSHTHPYMQPDPNILDIPFRSVRTGRRSGSLYKSGALNLYLIPDRPGGVIDAIQAARRFVRMAG